MSTISFSDPRVQAELARVLHRQAPASLLGGLVVAVALLVTVWNQVPPTLILVWVVLYVATSAIRLGLWYAYREEIVVDAVAIGWQRSMSLALVVSGLAWGTGAWLFSPSDLSEIFTAVIIIFSVLIAGAIGSLAAAVSTYIFYSLPVALVLTWRMIESPQFLPIHGVGYLIFVLVCFQYARNLQQYMIESTGLKLEREALVTELTERSRLLSLEAARADAASEAKSRFLAVASHDLAQPMNALELFMTALKREKDELKRNQLVTSAAESTRVISEMFTSLLDLSRLDSEAVQVSLQPASLRELTDLLQREFQPQAEEKGLQFHYDVGDYTIKVDPVLLQRMLRNLLNNALQYTDSGSITLSAKLADNHVSLSVRDTGKGIPADQLQQVFDERFQGTDSTGLGLGLSLVKGFASLQHIAIEVDSRVGEGSSFLLQIPLNATVAETPAGTANPTPVEGLNILLLEDDESARFGIITLLEQWRANHISGASWSEVETQILDRSFTPDIIVSDYHLSQYENALDVLDRAREIFNPAPPMIVTTGNRSSELADTLANLRVKRLIKPVNPDELMHTISELAAGLRV